MYIYIYKLIYNRNSEHEHFVNLLKHFFSSYSSPPSHLRPPVNSPMKDGISPLSQDIAPQLQDSSTKSAETETYLSDTSLETDLLLGIRKRSVKSI